MIRQPGSIKLSSSPGGRRSATTKGNIQMVKHRLHPNKRVSAQKLSTELRISLKSVRRIMKNDLELRSYKIVIKPLLFNDQKIKQRNLQIGFEQKFRKEDTMRIFFSDEKFC